MLLSAAISLSANLENTAVATEPEQVSFHSNRFPEKGSVKECSNYHTIAVISHARLGSKSFQVGFSGTWTENFQMYNLGLKKVKEPEIKLSTSARS